ncbi:extracellular solute-binding protein [Roseomonas elaeocarpi]|uniref:Extracellular solute-binding protein n=1 Tax=Roseomonas elaeocarpi TaxID=907779 RepID=A0ABV6JWH7_9PROT
MFRRNLFAASLATATLPVIGRGARGQSTGAQAPATPTPAAPGAAAASTGAARRTHALSLLGEPKLPADFPHWAWVNPDAPKGGEFVRTALGSFDSFNPFILRGTPAVGITLLFETLLMDSADEASTAYAHLAAVVEVAADNSWAAFELRPEARWHDGRPVTAEDAAWSFATLREKGHPRYRNYWGDIEGATAENERRVVFRFRNPGNRELPLIIGQMPVLPKHWWEGRDFAQPGLELPLGSGPYKVGRFEAGRSMVLQRVPDYWGRDLPTMRGLQNFDTQRFEYYRDATVAFEGFKAGQLDFRQENIARSWATQYDFPAVARGLVKRDELHHEIPAGMQAFIMNLRRPVFADRRTREALGLVFDFEWMNANLFYNSYTRTNSYFANSELASSGVPQGRELEILQPFRDKLPPALFTQAFKLPTTDGSGNNRDNARRALDLLREAGWVIKDRQMVDRNGQPLRFEILLADSTYERVALPYVQSLTRLGVQATVRTVDAAQYQVRTDNFDFDMTIDLFGQSLSPGNEQRDFWGSEAAKQPGSRNTIGISDPVVDALVELVINAPNREELVTRTHALDRVLLWNFFVVPNWYSSTFRIAWWDKFGRPPRNPHYNIGIEGWWIDPAREKALSEARRSPT